MNFVLQCYVFCYTIVFIYCQDTNETTVVVGCREKNRKVTSEFGDFYELVEVLELQTVMLQCHFCNEADDEQPKNWFTRIKGIKSSEQELQVDMENNVTKSRIYVNLEHTLIIHNVTFKDMGFYLCYGLDDQEKENLFNYVIDVVTDVNVTNEEGVLEDWDEYHEYYFQSLNKKFVYADGREFLDLRRNLNFSFEVVTFWREWGRCETCGRPQGEGVKKKEGLCRVKINNANPKSEFRNDNITSISNMFEMSCRSLLIPSIFPYISSMLYKIPHFTLKEQCTGLCNPDTEGFYRGWKNTKKGFKYRKTIVLAENSHLTIICPESTLENSVLWSFNGKKLPSGEAVVPKDASKEPKIIVDTFNTLYLHSITKNEEGNFTCTVDDVRMQQILIFVVAKSRLLTQAMVRHIIYLFFVLCMTTTCYCAGLFITYTKRKKFKTYEELRVVHEKEDTARLV